MQRLIESGLMFGNLFHVTSPALVDRYNRALEHLTGRTTGLTDFHVDISGYSPEIGDEFDDHCYLNHGGVNRQFILLAIEQKRCPLLNSHFSSNRQILRRFIDDNERQLFALTTKDAVAGELDNSVFSIERVEELFAIRRITVEADTTCGTLMQAERLADLIDRFHSEKDGWCNDELIAEMIEVAKHTGDITRNPVELEHSVFEQQNFWTSLFGGLYIFQDVEEPGVIACGECPKEKLPITRVIPLEDTRGVARFLYDNDLIEPIVKAPGPRDAGVLRKKQDILLASTLASHGIDPGHAAGKSLWRLALQQGVAPPPAYDGLASVIRWAEQGGAKPRIHRVSPAYFYTVRASSSPIRDLVNMLLAELAPNDILQLYICHKTEFYRRYREWSRLERDYAIDCITREYISDKATARSELFGSSGVDPGKEGRGEVDSTEE